MAIFSDTTIWARRPAPLSPVDRAPSRRSYRMTDAGGESQRWRICKTASQKGGKSSIVSRSEPYKEWQLYAANTLQELDMEGPDGRTKQRAPIL